ncbi:unnamed protein product [Rotaria sp. Silwood2]|nr:unnamed protein product [Rotaria sp. Silwood2]CAF4438444.1 unnamed protein product [Rotaria sp. Silwood2]
MKTVPANARIDLITQIVVHVNRVFSIDTVFSFTYQWLDSYVLNFFHWPQWPLKKSCANRILNDIIQNRTSDPQRHFSCSITSILTHSTSRQLFTDERVAITDWLDVQYNATKTHSFSREHPLNDQLSSTTRTRRLSSFEVASNTKVCSVEFYSWISKYQDWHANISSSISDPRLTFEEQRDRIVEQNIRFMLYKKSPSGTADRIVHLMTTYLIAILTNRLFLFDEDWPEFSHVMLTSLNYERESVIPWFRSLGRLNKYLSRNDSKYLTSGEYKFSFDRLSRDYNYDREFSERILIFQAHTGGIGHMMTSQTSVYRKFLTEDLHMHADSMFGCLYHSLFLYRLSALIERTSISISTDSLQQEQLGHSSQQLLQVLLSPNFYPIGIQVRTGDATMKDDNSKSWFKRATSENSVLESYQYFLTCARDIVDGNQTFLTNINQVPIAFLISDTARLRRAALLRWKLPSSCLQSLGKECRNQTHSLPIIANSNPVLHIAYTSQRLLALHLAMFDVFLFGLCEQHVISVESGFGNIGAFAALKQRNVYSLSTLTHKSCVGKNQDIPMVNSSYQWSGI